jgi:HK97 family phage major capsid protein
MRNPHAIVLRKIRGVFGACWQGAPSRFAGSPAVYPASPTSGTLLGSLGAIAGALLLPMLVLATIAFVLVALPVQHEHVAKLPMLGGVALAGTTAEIKDLADKVQNAIAEMRAANDEKLKEIEKKGAADPLLVARVEKANADVTALKAELDEVRAAQREAETANARLTSSRSDVRDQDVQNARRFFSLTRGKKVVNITNDDLKEYQDYRNAFGEYLRRGDQALADREINNALSTGAAPNGGFWLTPDSSGKIVEFLEDLSSMRKLATVDSIGTDTFEGNYDLDEASSGWVGETETRSETNTPRIDGKYSFPIFEQYAAPKASQKMLDDSETDVETWLAKKVAAKLAKTENTAFVTGDGITKPKGFTQYSAGTPARTSVANYRKIRQLTTGVSGGFAASSPGDKLIDVIQAIPSALRGGSVFAMNPLTAAETRKLKDGQGNYLFIPDFSRNPNGSILGYPVEELSDMADIGANSLSIAFGNFKESYVIKDHVVGTRVLRDPYTAKPHVVFYTTKRVGGDVVNFQGIVLLKFG